MVTNQEIYKKISSILTKTFKVDSVLIREDANLEDDLGLDSVELMDAICVLEEEFKTKIIEKDAENIPIPNTINDLVALVSHKVNKAAVP